MRQGKAGDAEREVHSRRSILESVAVGAMKGSVAAARMRPHHGPT